MLSNDLFLRRWFGALTLTMALFAGSAHAAFMDRVLVIVNEDVITQAEFDYRLQSVVADFQANNQAVPPNLAAQLLDGMISDKPVSYTHLTLPTICSV